MIRLNLYSVFLLTLAWLAAVPAFADGKPPQRVTALWSNPQHLDLFEVDASGEVISTWWEGGCSWQPWFHIHPESGKSIAANLSQRSGIIPSTWICS